MLPQKILIPVAALLAAAALLASCAWRSPPIYDGFALRALDPPVMTLNEYAQRGPHATPYVVEAVSDSGAALIFGARHTRDPADPQLQTLEERWYEFHPTVALVEGRLGFLMPGVMDPVRRYGESGKTMALARRDGVPVFSWEPTREAEVARMLDAFPPERVALFYVLRPYVSSRRFGRPKNPDATLEAARRKRTRIAGLEGTLRSVAHVDSIWQRDFAGLPDWRDTSDELGWPGYLAPLAVRAGIIRDEHLAQTVVDLAQKGERVFVSAGASHGVTVEPALRGAF